MSIKFLVFFSFLGVAFGGRCHLRGICDKDTSAPCVVDSGLPNTDSEPRIVDTSQLEQETKLAFDKLCPNYKWSDELCCDHDNIKFLVDTLEGEMKKWFGRCPSCYHNIASLYCAISCDPNQADFVSSKRLEVTYRFPSNVWIDVNERVVTGIYDSCKNVRHRQIEAETVMDTFCTGSVCFDVDFFKRIVRDFPLKNARTTGIMITDDAGFSMGTKSLDFETTSCDKIAPGADSPCNCNDCPARNCGKDDKEPKEEVTEKPKEEVTRKPKEDVTEKPKDDGKGSGTKLFLNPFVIGVTIIFVYNFI